MTLVQLSYVAALARHRHFADAAAACHVSQPTLSMQIRKLEDEIGALIFDRSKQPVIPTAIGAMVIQQARTVLREAGRIDELIAEAREEIKGDFRLGIIPTLAPGLLPLFLGSFRRSYPKVALVVEEMQTASILEGLRHDDLDAGLLATPVNTPGLIEQPLFYEPFVAYISPRHPLFKQNRIRTSDIPVADLWLLNEGHCFREQALQLCGARAETRDTSHNFQFASGNLETLKKLVERHYGITLLPWLEARDLPGAQQRDMLRKFEEPVPTREISLLLSRTYLKRQITTALAQEIRKAVPPELLKVSGSFIVGIPSLGGTKGRRPQ